MSKAESRAWHEGATAMMAAAKDAMQEGKPMKLPPNPYVEKMKNVELKEDQ